MHAIEVIFFQEWLFYGSVNNVFFFIENLSRKDFIFLQSEIFI